MKSVFEEWEFVKSIPINSKPCFYSKTFIGVNDWFVTLRRRWNGEKGEKGVVYLENLINTTMKILESENISTDELKKMKKLLEESILGLNNLVCTYTIDNQKSVAEEYGKIIKNVKNIVTEIDLIISKRNKGTFFGGKIKLVSE